MNKKIITIISVLVLVILAGGFWFVENKKKEDDNKKILQEEIATQNNSRDQKEADLEEISTSDWDIYINEGWGYSIKYPKELYIKDNPQGDKFPGDISSCPYCGHGGQTLIISDQEKMGIQDIMLNEKIHITITTQKVNSNFNDGKAILEYLESGDENISKIKIEGMDAYNIIPNSDQNNFISIYIIKNEWVYHLGGINYIDKNTGSDNFKLMREILRTFKFTK